MHAVRTGQSVRLNRSIADFEWTRPCTILSHIRRDFHKRTIEMMPQTVPSKGKDSGKLDVRIVPSVHKMSRMAIEFRSSES